MVELRPSNFRMIYIALKIDWILSLVLPLVLFGLMFALDHQLRRPGIASPNIGTEEISLSSYPLTRLLYSYYAIRYCASGLCSLLAVKGLGDIRTFSVKLIASRKWFAGCMLMNAAAMAARIVQISLNFVDIIGPLRSLYPAVEAVTLALLGAAIYTLVKGYGELFRSIGEQKASFRADTLARWVPAAFIAFDASYIAFMTDLLPEGLPGGYLITLLILFVTAFCFCMGVRFKVICCARTVWKTLAAISDEVTI